MKLPLKQLVILYKAHTAVFLAEPFPSCCVLEVKFNSSCVAVVFPGGADLSTTLPGSELVSPGIFQWFKRASHEFLPNAFPDLGETRVEGKFSRKL